MGNTKWLWRVTGLFGLLTTAVLVIGMGYAVNTILYPKGEELPGAAQGQPAADVTPTPMNHPDKIQILALGDSLTKGVGDEKGEGYIGRVKRQLENQSDKPVYVWNFAVNGATTQDLLAEINKPASADYIKQADIILFTIGGNDLNRIATSVTAAPTASPAQGTGNGTSTALPAEISFNFEALSKQLPESVKRLGQIAEKLAVTNPKARILYLGLYHPFMEFDPTREGAAWIGKWNNAVFEASNRYPNITIVPTYDIFQSKWLDLLYTDHFHPNGAGYDEMAARVMQVLK
ncbi:GDSL-type esterase/lipase family protein [Gorillibacterium sp. sgz5001074]|uniref:GDSL-type esterase/lipase family protein n=1 Tax=Gorillibacterium sp. sgz5001074 TaxID=3446695 RepID=UPI003F66191D